MKYKFKAKPDVDAIQWTGYNLQEIMEFLGDKFIRVAASDPTTIAVKTSPGPRFVTAGMFLIRRSPTLITAKESAAFLKEYEPA